MNSWPHGGHPGDDDLVLHYYGEHGPGAARDIEAHLAACESCHASFEALDEVLSLVTAHAGEEAPEGFERVMWARVGPAIQGPARGGWRAWFTAARMGLAGAMALLVVAAFVAGRWSTPLDPDRDAIPLASVAPEGVWLSAVADHLERSQMVLAELLNGDPAAPVSLVERERAADLVASSRLIRQAATSEERARVADVLEELERVLIEIANGGDDATAADREMLRTRIEDRGVLFRLRVMGLEVRERGLRRAPVS